MPVKTLKSAVLILRKGLLRLDQFGSSWFVGIAADFQQLAKISLAGIVISAELGGARCAVERAGKRPGSFASVASNCVSARAGSFISSNISPSSSRAGASGPGVTALLSVASSSSAADLRPLQRFFFFTFRERRPPLQLQAAEFPPAAPSSFRPPATAARGSAATLPRIRLLPPLGPVARRLIRGRTK